MKLCSKLGLASFAGLLSRWKFPLQFERRCNFDETQDKYTAVMVAIEEIAILKKPWQRIFWGRIVKRREN